jgi:hypothetical protein
MGRHARLQLPEHLAHFFPSRLACEAECFSQSLARQRSLVPAHDREAERCPRARGDAAGAARRSMEMERELAAEHEAVCAGQRRDSGEADRGAARANTGAVAGDKASTARRRQPRMRPHRESAWSSFDPSERSCWAHQAGSPAPMSIQRLQSATTRSSWRCSVADCRCLPTRIARWASSTRTTGRRGGGSSRWIRPGHGCGSLRSTATMRFEPLGHEGVSCAWEVADGCRAMGSRGDRWRRGRQRGRPPRWEARLQVRDDRAATDWAARACGWPACPSKALLQAAAGTGGSSTARARASGCTRMRSIRPAPPVGARDHEPPRSEARPEKLAASWRGACPARSAAFAGARCGQGRRTYFAPGAPSSRPAHGPRCLAIDGLQRPPATSPT